MNLSEFEKWKSKMTSVVGGKIYYQVCFHALATALVLNLFLVR